MSVCSIAACRVAAPSTKPRCALTMLLATVAMLGASGAGALAGDEAKLSALVAQPGNEELIKKLLAMEQRVQALEKQLKQKQAAAAGAAPPTPPPPPAAGKKTNRAPPPPPTPPPT